MIICGIQFQRSNGTCILMIRPYTLGNLFDTRHIRGFPVVAHLYVLLASPNETFWAKDEFEPQTTQCEAHDVCGTIPPY